MPALTRRRDPDARQECWRVFYDGVDVGAIALRTGCPVDVDQWEWRCGFPAMNRDAIMTELLETDGELSLAKPTLTLELHKALGRRHGRNYGRRGYVATADGIKFVKFVDAQFVIFVAHVALLRCFRNLSIGGRKCRRDSSLAM
jgi:hypothetical protein